ncbi:MAG: hypothetical protein U0524_01510 [Candidatus Saccharimonadales bacterium]
MNDVFSINIRAVKRIAYTMLAAFLVVAGLPFLQSSKVSADLFTNRSIQMSDSSPSGGTITSGVGSGENVTYRVSFDAIHAAGSIVIDFCGGSSTPILNDACTAPTGMDASAATLSGVTGNVDSASWDVTATASQIKLANSTSPTDDIAANSTEVFDLSGITNQSATGTFFARIYTFPDDSWGTYVDADTVNLDPNSDFGGIALSTAAVITITARVQESITFCVSNADPTTWTAAGGGTAYSCSASEVADNPPAVTIGHTVGGTTLVLDSGVVDKGDTPIWSQLSTNATHGAVINLRSNWACGGLSADGGTTCAIPPVGDTATIMTPGDAAFGIFVSDSYGRPEAVGATTPSAAYNDGVNENETDMTQLAFGMDNTTATAQVSGQSAYSGSVSGTFGSTLAKSTGPTYRVQNRYIFGATAALTTPAGIYTSNMTMTATGTF